MWSPSVSDLIMFKNHYRLVITTSVLIIKFLMINFWFTEQCFVWLLCLKKPGCSYVYFQKGMALCKRFFFFFLFLCLFVCACVSFLLLLLTLSDLIWIYSVGSTKKCTIPTCLDAATDLCCCCWDSVQCERFYFILNLCMLLPEPPFYFHSFIWFGLTCISKHTMIIPSPQVICSTDNFGTNETRLVKHFVCICLATRIAVFTCCCRH